MNLDDTTPYGPEHEEAVHTVYVHAIGRLAAILTAAAFRYPKAFRKARLDPFDGSILGAIENVAVDALNEAVGHSNVVRIFDARPIDEIERVNRAQEQSARATLRAVQHLRSREKQGAGFYGAHRRAASEHLTAALEVEQ